MRAIIDYFVPRHMLDQREESNLTMVRTFVLLHFIGPAMGHSVTLFLWFATGHTSWQFWTIEAAVLVFFAMPFMVKATGGLTWPSAVSTQTLVFVSLFGSYFYGGISSPFLPWLLIALLISFFFMADHIPLTLMGIGAQILAFAINYYIRGGFPDLVPLASLKLANLLSLVSALAYITMMSLYYESVMRDGAELEQATREQRSRTVALRKAMEAAERSSRQKTIFLAKMSHELRTPLNAVIGYSEMLRDDLEGETDKPERAQDLDRINAAGRHLLALVNEVLDLSSIERNHQEITNEPICFETMIEQIVATAAPLVAKKDNKLVVLIPEPIGMMMTDPLKLRQCVLNLLSNAAKFTSRGVISLSARKRFDDGGSRIVIEVHDSGIGISPENLERIFASYGQAENSTARNFGGTGLGLALTRRFCELMGGRITVQSEIGCGSLFTIDVETTYLDETPSSQQALAA